MGTIIFFSVAGIVALLLMVIGGILFFVSQDEDRSINGGVGAVVGVVASLVLGVVMTFMSATTVDPKNVAVVTEFGKPTEVLGNGFHWIPFYADTVTFDGTIQRMQLFGNGKDRGDDNEIVVRLKDDGRAWIDVELQWRINVEDKEGVKRLYADYKDPARVDENFVEKTLRSAVSDAFATVDPMANIKNPGDQPLNNADMAKKVNDLLKERINVSGISIVAFVITDRRFDGDTENRLTQLRQILADQRLADEQKTLNEKKSAANANLTAGAKDGPTLYRECLEMTEKLLRDGKTLPPAWTCDGAKTVTTVPVR